MSTATATVTAGALEWKTGWTVQDPLAIPFIFVRGNEGWKPGPYPGTELRDLGIADVTHGKMGGTHLRVTGDGTQAAPGWVCKDYDFQFFFVWKGSVKIRTHHGDSMVLSAGDAITQPRGLKYQFFGFSDDLEIIEIVGPADAADIAEPSAARGQYLEDTRGAYVLGNGPRRFFEYRDLGTRGPTGERIHIHVVRATTPCPAGGTGWHDHTMSQWFMILGGRGEILVEGRPDIRPIGPGDAMCLQAGQRHNVSDFNERYTVLELCLPAEYDTTATPPPDGYPES